MTSGSGLGGASVTISGKGFEAPGAGETTVSFGGVLATNVVVLSDVSLTCDVPPGAPGETVDVTVSNGNGSQTLVGGFTYLPAPVLTSLAPAAGTTLGGTEVVLTGVGFTANSAGVNEVEFGGEPATQVVTVSDTRITCTVPAGAAGEAVDVVVSNANGGGTAIGGFTYHPTPVVSSVAPASMAYFGGAQLSIRGTGFVDLDAGSSTVLLGELPATNVTVVSDTLITCIAPSGLAGTSVDVGVLNANGQGTLLSGFSYHALPTLGSVAPDSGTPLGGTSLTLTGSGFLGFSAGLNAVSLGGQPATDVVAVDDVTLTCVAPAGVSGSVVDVVVSNLNGQAVLGAGWRYHATPTLSSLSPVSGAPAGGGTVTVNGSGFLNDVAAPNRVFFGGVEASAVVVVNDSTLTCTVPPGPDGAAVDVVVTNGNGTATASPGFIYHSEPILVSVTPNSGSSLGGGAVTLFGAGFVIDGAGANTVDFDGAPATSVTTLDDNTITCVAPSGAPGTAALVQVTNSNGAAPLAAGYAYFALPTLSAVSPAAGSSLGGAAVTLSGSGFQDFDPGTNAVVFGGSPATSVVVVDDSTLTCLAPPGTPEATVDVALVNGNGAALLAGAFSYHALPAVDSVAPSSGSSLGGTSVTLSGTGFADDGAGTNVVTFGGVPATSVVTVSDTALTCVAPAGSASSTVDVAVTNDNGTGTLVSGFAYHAEPALTSLAPSVGTSLGGTAVTLSGSGFSANGAGACAVTFDGAAATSIVVIDDSTLTCVAPAGSAGMSVDVVVSNANGSNTLSASYSYYPVPVVSSSTPAVGTSLGGTAVTVGGTGFQANEAGANGVTFDGVAATSVVVVNDTTITCVSPTGSGGAAVEVVVTNLNGSGTLSPGFTYYPTPTVTAVAPASGSYMGGEALTVSGTGFTANGAASSSVTLGGASATSVVVVDDTMITCVAPAGTRGAAVDVLVANTNGSGTLSSGFAYHPAPVVSSVAPTEGTSLGGTSVTVTGTGFSANTAGSNAVTFDGVPATSIVVVNDTTITCVTPPGTAGTSVDVGVTNDNGSGTRAGGYAFFAAPSLASASPSGGTSLGGTSVTLNGTGFLANGAGTSTVTFGGAAATSVVVASDSSLTCVTPAGTAGAAVDVVVSNANGDGTLSGGFVYFPESTVTAVSPDSSPQGGGVAVTVTGSGFLANGAGTNTLTFGASAATTVVVLSDTTITCVAPAGTAGTNVDVAVTNANGTGALVDGWLYHPEPTVTGVAPAAGSALGGGSVTVSGTGFQANAPGTNSVTFGGVQASGVTVVDDTTITCSAPAGTAGASVSVAVANANGSGSMATAYSYHAAPLVTSVAPSAGTSLGGTGVTVTGTGFVDNGAGAATVTFDGAAATGVTVVSDTTLTCTAPSGTSGASADVVVSNANGAGTLSSGYAYHSAPDLGGVAPSSGLWQGGTSVTLTGTGFSANEAGVPSVEFDGVAATSVVVVDDTTITCDTPAGTPGALVEVEISNANGADSLVSGYTYFARPAVTAIAPASASSLGGASVTLTGSGFTDNSPGANSVTFGGVSATSIVSVSDTTLTCEVPAGTPGAVVDVVVSNANGTGTLSAGFTYHDEPVLFSIGPAVGGEVGGTAVTLSGTGFLSFDAGTATVTFGGAAATSVVVLNNTTITCSTPAGSADATVDVALSNDNGSDVLLGGFTYHPPPGLTAVAPAQGSSLGATLVTLTGTGFLDNSAGTNLVTFDGVAATEIVVFSDTSIQCEAPAGTPSASVDVAVANDNGSATLASAFAYHALPTLAGVSPGAGTSTGGETVTLTGTGFQANSAGTNSVTFGAEAASSVTVVDDTTITCTAPQGSPGTSADVVLTNTNGAATLASSYDYHALPTLTAVAPASGTSLGGTAVTLTGSGFSNFSAGTNAVEFDGSAATSVVVVSDTEITCVAPLGSAGSTVDVEVSNTNGAASLSDGWTYHALPTLTAVSPTTGSPAGGTSVTLTGTGFQADSPGTHTVTFGGVAATSVAVVNDTTITCDAPGGAPATSVDVLVGNDNGSATLAGAFTFYPPPGLTSIAADHGPEAGGASVTLTGSGFEDNFPGTNTVTLGGVAATSVVVVSDTTITCTTPAGTAGTSVDVVLTNDNGSDTLTNGYDYFAPPTVSSVDASSGTSLGGVSATITGTGFQANGAGTNTVTVGGALATSVTVVSDTSITCLTPTGSAGTAQDVTVANVNGAATLASGYTYHPTPAVSGAAPLFGSSDGATSVTLTGTGFLDNAPGTHSVLFDGVPATSVVVVDDTSITCTTPSGSSGPIDVVVSNANGSDTLTAGFDYNDPQILFAIDKQWAEDGVAFSFTPSVGDPDPADTQTFSSTGTALPAWVTLNTSTGEISGTPAPADIGVTVGIELSVDDGFHVSAFGTFDLEVTGPATTLAFGAAPAASEQQDEPWTEFTVRAEDSSGNLVGTWSTPVVLALASGSGSLSGTLSQTPVGGVATFDAVSYDTAEAITFDLTSSGLSSLAGTAITISAAPTTKLTFAAQPSDIEYKNVSFAFVVVEVQDASGNRISADNTTQIDLALGTGTGTLSGTLSRVVTEGRAIFDDLSYSKVETIDLVATSVPATTTRTSESTIVRANPSGSLAAVRASLDSDELEGGAASRTVAISANGRIVAFESVATNLVDGDSNGARDIFVRDRVSGSTERVSVDSAGGESNGDSFAPALSANGRFVAFESAATDLVAGDSNAAKDVFVHDRESGTTVRVSVDSSAAQASGDSAAATLSSSGLEIAFESAASDLVAGDSNGARDIFLHDRVTGTTERLSLDSADAEASGASAAPSISGDGDVVAFESEATDLVAGDANGVQDIFVRQRAAGITSRVSVDSVAGEANGASSSPAISGDGLEVAFASDASDLVAADTNGVRDIFVHTIASGATARVSVDGSGAEGDGASDSPAISGDGDSVVFESAATDLTPDDDEGHSDVFLHRRGAGATARLSTAAGGSGGDAASAGAVISADGKHAALSSLATDLVAGDANAVEDAFFRPIHDPPTLASAAPVEGTALGGTSVTLTGTGFESTSAGTPTVFFDGLEASGVSVSSDAILTCVTPAGASGTVVDVVVVTNNGVATLISGWSYRSAPTVSLASPSTGVGIGGTAITITGTGFTSTGFGSNSVTFGGVPATSVATVNDTTLTCVTPAGTAGASVDVAVTNNNSTGSLGSGFTYHDAPTLSALSPASGHASGGDAITLTGTGFLDNTAGSNAVTFGGVAATSVVVVDDTTITCVNPAGTVGSSEDVVVANDNGAGTLAGGFGYNPAPDLLSIAPAGGSPLGGTAITLTGTGFLNNSVGTTTVTIDGDAAASVSVVDDTTITCVAPAGVAGSLVDVVVSNGNGDATLADGFSFNPQPTLTSLAAAVGTSLGGTSVTLTGTGLQNSSAATTVVTFDGVAASSVLAVDDTTLTCDTPAGTAGATVDVVLTNGNGTATLSSAFSFHPVPTLASSSPSQGAQNGGTAMTLSGSGFTANAAGSNVVTIGGNAATSVVTLNNTTLTCVAPAGSSSGASDIVVSNNNGSATLPEGFTYNVSPTVTAVAPAQGASLGGAAVTITGTGFLENGAAVNTVEIGGASATHVVVVNDTSITCDVPAGVAGASVDVEVSNANGTGSLVGGFTYYPAPDVTLLTPSAGSSLGATAVTLTGTGFSANDAGTNSVTIGGAAATDVVVASDTSITCTAPAGTPGASVDVVVSNGNGSGTLAGGYTYHAEPTVSGVSPAAGTSLGGTAVTVSGSGFAVDSAGSNSVAFGGVPATSVVVVDDTTITCVAPAGTAGASVAVSVANDNGSGSLAGAYDYHSSATVSGVAPSTGTSLGGTAVTVTGTGFLSNDAGVGTVSFDGVAATSVVVVDDTTITCVTPAGAAGTSAAVVVTNDNGSGSLSSAYSYHSVPTVSAVASSAGSPLGGASVTLTGTGFSDNGAGANTVTFDGAAATSVVVVDDTTLTCVSPAGSAGASVDVVASNANGSGTLAEAYSYHPNPTVASISPGEGTPLGGVGVTISGTGFVANSAGVNGVEFDGVAATGVVVLNDNALTCDSPAGAPGTTVDIVVTNDNGSGTGTDVFSYHAGPAVDSVSPSAGSPLGATAITLTGSGFVADGAGAAAITIDGAAVTSVTIVSDTTITCVTPAGTAGLASDIVVSNANGSGTLAEGFTYHPNPAVSSVSPATGTQSGGTPLTITGTGFVTNDAGSTSLTLGGVAPGSVVVVSDTTITCVSLAGSPGASLDVTASNANGSGTLVGGFAYNAEPSVTAVSPALGSSLGGAAVTLTGTGFQDFDPGANGVTFGGSAASSVVVVNDTTITCAAPAGAAGTSVDVILTNSNGSGTLASGFSYHSLPTVTAVAPSVGTSLGGTALTITGTGFVDHAAGANGVTLDGVAATSVVTVNDRTITCVAPVGVAGTSVDVAVSNSNGTGVLSGGFGYHAAPSATAVTPTSGTSLGGTASTITGTGFTANAAGTNSVSFAGVAATSVVVLDDTTITCVAPAGTAGAAVDVVVSNDNGTGTLGSGFAYHAEPSVTAASPSSGPAVGGTATTLTGTGFQDNAPGANSVTIGGVAATSVVVVNDTTLTCVTPAGTPAAEVDIVVSNANGSGTRVDGFHFLSNSGRDLDDDGIDDLVVGAPGAAAGDGAAYVFLGSASGLTDTSAGSADIGIATSATGAALGSASAVGDLNDDGYADLVLGAPGETAVHVFWGPLVGPNLSTAGADVTIDGAEASDDFGAALAIDDLDGDGRADLVCGAPLNGVGSEGAVYVFLGSASFAPSSAAAADHEFVGASGDQLGAALAAGDIDADSQADLAIGAPGGDRALIFLGGVGFSGGPASAANATLDAEVPGDAFGASLAWGDVEGDGNGDLIVGAPANDGGGTDTGAAYVFVGVAGFPSSAAGAASTRVSGEAAGDALGAALAASDIDGDGTPELLIGANGWDLDLVTTDVGRTYLFAGGTLGASLAASGADAIYTGELVVGEGFGTALSAVDLDDDGRGDLVVGAPDADGGGADAGRVYLFLGSAIPVDTAATADDVTLSGAAAGDSFGAGLVPGS